MRSVAPPAGIGPPVLAIQSLSSGACGSCPYSGETVTEWPLLPRSDRVMWWGPQRRRGWAFRDPSCETARFPGLAVCPSAGLRQSPSIRVPSEATTALFAKCLWCSAMSPEPTFTLQCEEPKRPEPKHHPVGLTAGSPAQTLSRGAAMRGGPSRKRNGICLPGACGMCGCMMRGIDEYRQQVIWGPMEVIRSNPGGSVY